MFGTGLLKGLGVTLKHALDTFEDDRETVPDRYRGSLELGNNRKRDPAADRPGRAADDPVSGGEAAAAGTFPLYPYADLGFGERSEDRCTACGICAKVCPPQCIWIVRDSDENGKPMTRCSDFYIDAAVCMSCSFCVEFCPFDAIKMNHDYELAVYDRYPQLVYDMAELTVPLEYYAALWPTQYEEEQARRKEEEEQKRKQEEEKAAKAAARAAAKSAAAAEGDGYGWRRRPSARRQSCRRWPKSGPRSARPRHRARGLSGSDDDDAAAAKTGAHGGAEAQGAGAGAGSARPESGE